MIVMLKLVLDCPIDDATDAISDPLVLREILSPLVALNSVEPGGLPDRWRDGDDHRVFLRAFGLIPLGVQVIGVRTVPRDDSVRMMRDIGGGDSGPQSFFTAWDHRLAVSPLPNGRTLYRDRLRFSAGPFTALAWPVMWALWQWRGAKLQRLVASRNG